MTDVLSRAEPHLFFFRSLEESIRARKIDKERLSFIKQQFVEMSLRFADRYFSVIYKIHLRMASYTVLGITNLGAIRESNGDMLRAAVLFTDHPPLFFFRRGWAELQQLVRLHREALPSEKARFLRRDFLPAVGDEYYIISVERDLAQYLIAEPDTLWKGDQHFASLREEYSEIIKQNEVRERLVRRFAPQHYDEQEALPTLFASLFAGPKPHVPLSLGEVNQIIKRVGKSRYDTLVRTFRTRAGEMQKFLPSMLRLSFETVRDSFVESRMDGLRVEIERDGRATAFETCLRWFIVRDDDASAIDRGLYREARMLVAELDRLAIPLMFEELSELDVPYRIALIERVAKERPARYEEICALLCFSKDEEWAGKLAWHCCPWPFVADLISEDEIRDSSKVQIASELFLTGRKKPNRRWFADVPFSIALWILKRLPPHARKELAAMKEFAAEELVRELRKEEMGSLFFLKPGQWYYVATEFAEGEDTEKFLGELAHRAPEYLEWTGNETVAYLVQAVECIRNDWRLAVSKNRGLAGELPPLNAMALNQMLEPWLNPCEREMVLQAAGDK